MRNRIFNSRFHNAFNDAFYTSEIFKRIFNENLKTSIYNPNTNKYLTRENTNRTKLDTDKLINQFEKMYNKEMSEEEKSIINLAYKMGNTNQFQYII